MIDLTDVLVEVSSCYTNTYWKSVAFTCTSLSYFDKGLNIMFMYEKCLNVALLITRTQQV